VPHALLTCFGPFLGRTRNGSTTVAHAVAALPWDAAWRITVIDLPVRWGEPQRILPDMLQRHQPDIALGLGEGHPGRIAVELTARNATAKLTDIDGAYPGSDRVLADGPDELPARLDMPEHGMSAQVEISRDAGRYLCNALLMTLLASAVPRAGFIHLPPQGSTADDAYAASMVPVITQVLRCQRVP
jgi:pyrrolidone-carboxylate peptidase